MPLRQRVDRSAAHIAAIQTSVANDLNQPIPRRSQELHTAKTTLWRILHKDIGLHPYKIMLTQELKPMDNSVHDLSKKKFGRCVISVNWLPCSFDLTPQYLFLCCYIKSLVYANTATTLEELRANIAREIAIVTAERCEGGSRGGCLNKPISIHKCFGCTSSWSIFFGNISNTRCVQKVSTILCFFPKLFIYSSISILSPSK